MLCKPAPSLTRAAQFCQNHNPSTGRCCTATCGDDGGQHALQCRIGSGVQAHHDRIRDELEKELLSARERLQERNAALTELAERDGLTGISMWSTALPPDCSASITALTTAGGDPIAPASPQPFTPNGLCVHGV